VGYLHINNLYKDQEILQQSEVYCLEKIHGTSAHVCCGNGDITFFAGGEKHTNFVALFPPEHSVHKLRHGKELIFYGEAYGGKQQGMSDTYGERLKFVVFDVRHDGQWLDVETAEEMAIGAGFEFVDYERVPCVLSELNRLRDADSTQAIRNGVGPGKKREGIVIRPLTEQLNRFGERLIVKHKRDDFRETATPREVRPEHQAALLAGEAVAEEWVTEMRLSHVLDKIPQPHEMKMVGQVIGRMVEDVCREGAGEFVDSREARKAIGAKAAKMFKARLVASLGG
jgi:hypothetical protein